MSRLFRITTGFAGAVLVALAILMFAFGTVSAQSNSITVTLNPLNNSGQSGQAVLTDLGNGQTKIDVSVTGEPADANQPMHIHNGSCTSLGSVKYPLTNVVDGKSSTTISASLVSLQTGNFAINAHKSAADMTTYVFCGEIPAAAGAQATQAATGVATATEAPMQMSGTPTAGASAPATAPTTGGSSSAPWVTLFILGLAALALGVFIRVRAR